MYDAETDIKIEVKEEDLTWEQNDDVNNDLSVDVTKVKVENHETRTKRRKNVIPIESPQCLTCHEKFVEDKELMDHYKINESHKPKRYMCTICHKSFDIVRELNDHKAETHSDRSLKTYECKLCSKSFRYILNLREHIAVHTGAKHCVCDECGESFFTHDTLLAHMRKVHINPANLTKSSGMQSALSNYLRVQTSQNEFVCVFCGKTYPVKLLLVNHIKQHRGLKIYECPTCSQCFKNAKTLRTHSCTSNVITDNEAGPGNSTNLYRTATLYTDDEFKNYFCISRKTFRHVIKLIKNKTKMKNYRCNKRSIKADLKLKITLWYFGMSDVAFILERYKISQPLALRIQKRVIQAICDLAPTVITWPNGENLENVRDGFNEMGLQNTIGSIGTTVYKHDNPVMLQAVCDHTLKFTHCYAKTVPTSMSDTEMLLKSDVWEFMNDKKKEMFPNDTHLVGNSTYPCLPTLMTPFSGSLTSEQAKFNHLLSEQNVVDRAFKFLQNRFRCLKNVVSSLDSKWATKYIMAACVLHNICIMQNDLIEVNNFEKAGLSSHKCDLTGVDQDRLDLGMLKRNELCEKL